MRLTKRKPRYRPYLAGFGQVGDPAGTTLWKCKSKMHVASSGSDGSKSCSTSKECIDGNSEETRRQARSEEGSTGQEACGEKGRSCQACPCAGSGSSSHPRAGGTGHQAFRALIRSGTAQSATGAQAPVFYCAPRREAGSRSVANTIRSPMPCSARVPPGQRRRQQ